MVRDIVKDQFLLSQKSVMTTKADIEIITDLTDTLLAHKGHCVGMAANMIGFCKRIIAFYAGEQMIVMINPEYMQCRIPYMVEEGCLCHEGVKEVQRFQKVKIAYEDETFKKKIKTFQGFEAEIIQHEMDHLEGILV